MQRCHFIIHFHFPLNAHRSARKNPNKLIILSLMHILHQKVYDIFPCACVSGKKWQNVSWEREVMQIFLGSTAHSIHTLTLCAACSFDYAPLHRYISLPPISIWIVVWVSRWMRSMRDNGTSKYFPSIQIRKEAERRAQRYIWVASIML